jgi:hypothetical protein
MTWIGVNVRAVAVASLLVQLPRCPETEKHLLEMKRRNRFKNQAEFINFGT